jgi:hypothetical protein
MRRRRRSPRVPSSTSPEPSWEAQGRCQDVSVEVGAHDDGPLGRIGWTVGLLLVFPWWALAGPLVSIWRKERVADGAPPTPIERFRERHPALGSEIRVGPTARLAILALAAVAAVALFLTKGDVDRYLFAAPVLLAGLTIALAGWNDL